MFRSLLTVWIPVVLFAAALVAVDAGRAAADSAAAPLVDDRANLLSEASESRLANLLQTHRQRTGVAIQVVTLPQWSAAVPSPNGDPAHDPVVIWVGMDDKRIRIDAGRITCLARTSAAAQIVATELVPRFARGEYESAILIGAEKLTASPAFQRPVAEPGLAELGLFLAGAVVALGATMSLVTTGRRGWFYLLLCGIGQSAMAGVFTLGRLLRQPRVEDLAAGDSFKMEPITRPRVTVPAGHIEVRRVQQFRQAQSFE